MSGAFSTTIYCIKPMGIQKDASILSKRVMCEICHYPLKTCVCSAVRHVANKTRIIILQDKNELKNAKNTVRLLALSLQNISIIQSDDVDGLNAVKGIFLNEPMNVALVFPSPDSRGFESAYLSVPSNQAIATDTVKHVIFIDGTWRKAKRLYLSHDWLQRIPSFHFEQALQGQYRIRKTSIDNGLSTLEAVAYVLANIEDMSVKPLYEVFEKMQSFWPQREA